ncbi:hypothetical protein F485_gp425 [Aeromonas phage CC2]|uniref:Uncharacterized protein n=1 Tax=Aeromonas phage CC2 TaxID=1204516 RepID=I6X791_9CAUD|nr:hypothetical protein F485_gp425 [Aeromonas phage CC2]AFN39297.1 hypothetical protein CC2_425 [Aeromonas phage CC2]
MMILNFTKENMGCEMYYTLWFDHWNNSASMFETQLELSGIKYEWEEREGDESTMGMDGLVYSFFGEEDLEKASNIYLDM